MHRSEFKRIRKKLDKTQKQMAQLLGVSLKAVHSYEQGWRVPFRRRSSAIFIFWSLCRRWPANRRPCWKIKNCPPAHRKQCPAAEFYNGNMCWVVNGSFCAGCDQGSWKAKMAICRTCPVFTAQVDI